MSETADDFWGWLDQLVNTSPLVIDRTKGSAHPRFSDMVYPLDYGFLEETRSTDGGGIDVWIGSAGMGAVQGFLCTVDLQKRDSEIKLLCGCTDEEIERIEEFLTQHAMRVWVVKR